ncbi:MAG: hypothetical protein QY332_10460 [Anaerolineales bacterium]|nr:MAG: hypothetical protein QY332_10460 [Anaerolineales bacterium]
MNLNKKVMYALSALFVTSLLVLFANFYLRKQDNEKLYSQDGFTFCLENRDPEQAIAILKDILVRGLPRYMELPEDYPLVEVLNIEPYPVSTSAMDAYRTSYRLVVDAETHPIEFFYRTENEHDSRFWPGFKIYLAAHCRWRNSDAQFPPLIVVFVREASLQQIVHQVLLDATRECP